MNIVRLSSKLLKFETDNCMAFIFQETNPKADPTYFRDYAWDIILNTKFANELRDKHCFHYLTDDLDYVVGVKLLHSTVSIPDSFSEY